MTEPSKRVDRRQWWWDGQRWRPYPGAKGRPPQVAPFGIRNVAGKLMESRSSPWQFASRSQSRRWSTGSDLRRALREALEVRALASRAAPMYRSLHSSRPPRDTLTEKIEA